MFINLTCCLVTLVLIKSKGGISRPNLVIVHKRNILWYNKDNFELNKARSKSLKT